MAKGNSWKTRNDNSSSVYLRPRKIAKRTLACNAQFTFEQLYIGPFSKRRKYEADGSWTYVPMEKNLKPTGIHVMDAFVGYLSRGGTDMTGFAESLGLRTTEIGTLVFILTGIKGVKFRQMYQMRMVDELLRYTSLPFEEVARLSGLGKGNNLYLALRREYNMNAKERRQLLQKEGDVGFFAL